MDNPIDRWAFYLPQEMEPSPGEWAMECAANRCPLCGNTTNKKRLSGMEYQTDCPVCGRYFMTGTYNKNEETLKIEIIPQRDLMSINITITMDEAIDDV